MAAGATESKDILHQGFQPNYFFATYRLHEPLTSFKSFSCLYLLCGANQREPLKPVTVQDGDVGHVEAVGDVGEGKREVDVGKNDENKSQLRQRKRKLRV